MCATSGCVLYSIEDKERSHQYLKMVIHFRKGSLESLASGLRVVSLLSYALLINTNETISQHSPWSYTHSSAVAAGWLPIQDQQKPVKAFHENQLAAWNLQ